MATLQEEIAAKANITLDQAKLAYDHVLETIKSKIPPSVGDEIHKVMDGKTFDFDSIKNQFSDKVTAATHDLQEKATEAYNNISEKATETFHNLTDQAKHLFDKKD